jgi:hypothetical protein
MACDLEEAALTAVAPVARRLPAEESRRVSSSAVETSTSAAPDEARGLWLLPPLLLPSESRSVSVGAAASDEVENGAAAAAEVVGESEEGGRAEESKSLTSSA